VKGANSTAGIELSHLCSELVLGGLGLGTSVTRDKRVRVYRAAAWLYAGLMLDLHFLSLKDREYRYIGKILTNGVFT